VDEWQKRVPDSGAAAFYHGIYLLLVRAPQYEVTRAFEEAEMLFRDESISAAGQSYQSEAAASTLSLCVSLFREDNKVGSLNCLKRLGASELPLFREITGWDGFIRVSRDKNVDLSTLYGAKLSNDEVTITNCRDYAEKNGMAKVRSYSTIRTPKPATTATAQPDAVMCSPDMCDCKAVDLKELVPHLYK